MGKVIMVSEEVYEKLRRLKRPGESFSDVIDRLIGRRPGLTDIAGRRTISREDWIKVQRMFKIRDILDEERRKRFLEMVGK